MPGAVARRSPRRTRHTPRLCSGSDVQDWRSGDAYSVTVRNRIADAGRGHGRSHVAGNLQRSRRTPPIRPVRTHEARGWRRHAPRCGIGRQRPPALALKLRWQGVDAKVRNSGTRSPAGPRWREHRQPPARLASASRGAEAVGWRRRAASSEALLLGPCPSQCARARHREQPGRRRRIARRYRSSPRARHAGPTAAAREHASCGHRTRTEHL